MVGLAFLVFCYIAIGWVIGMKAYWAILDGLKGRGSDFDADFDAGMGGSLIAIFWPVGIFFLAAFITIRHERERRESKDV